MKNVTPKAGQVWEYIEYKVKLTKVTQNTIEHVSEKNGYKYSDSIDDFLSAFKFIPQNDLEFWAVEIDVWPNDLWKSLWFRRDERGAITHEAQIIRTEWQNMRYDLGLDEPPKATEQDIQDFMDGKPKVFKQDFEAFAKGRGIAAPVHFNCPCKLTPLNEIANTHESIYIPPQKDTKMMYPDLTFEYPPIDANFSSASIPLKDTKMIDLSPFEIGDDLITRDGSKVKTVLLSDLQMITEDNDGSGCFNTHKLNGTCIDMDATGSFCSCMDIISKHDPRHWLKDLPDAGLFVDEINYISCVTGGWNGYDSEGVNCCYIGAFKMPKLTGDEWRDSKISIVDLRAWQVANKRAMGGPIKPGTVYTVGECGGPDVPVPAGPIATAD